MDNDSTLDSSAKRIAGRPIEAFRGIDAFLSSTGNRSPAEAFAHGLIACADAESSVAKSNGYRLIFAAIVVICALISAFLAYVGLIFEKYELIGAAVQTVTAGLTIAFTAELVRANNRLTELQAQAAAMETAKLRVVAGFWNGQMADVFVVNSGWKPTAIQRADIRIEPTQGTAASYQAQATRVYAQDEGKYDLLIQPGERVRLYLVPLGFPGAAAAVESQHVWVTLTPVLGECAPVDLKASLPRE